MLGIFQGMIFGCEYNIQKRKKVLCFQNYAKSLLSKWDTCMAKAGNDNFERGAALNLTFNAG